MILQALHQLAVREGLLRNPDYEPKPVAWLIRVNREGRLLGIEGTHTPVEDARTKQLRSLPKMYSVPRQPVRTSGDRAFFLVDKAEYVLGIDPVGNRSASKLEKRAQLFRKEVAACAEATGDEGVLAVLKFLDELGSQGPIALDDETRGNDLFAFVYSPDVDLLVSNRPVVREFWSAQRASSAEETGALVRCLITGALTDPGGQQVMLKRLPGASTSGVPLVSFNASAFESQGWKGNENAPISRHAAESYGTALNRLLHPAWPAPSDPALTLPRWNTRLAEDTVACFWATTTSGDDLASSLHGIFNADPLQVSATYQSVWRGRAVGLDDTSGFYALVLTGTQGRAIVRDWGKTTVVEANRNLADYFSDLAIVRNTPKPQKTERPPALPLRATLLPSLAVRGETKRLPKELATRFFLAALMGNPFPQGILARAVDRTKAEMGRHGWVDLERRDARAALIKATLNRARRKVVQLGAKATRQEVQFDMDPTNRNQGYVLGRLLAVIEHIQEEAIPGVNASVVDRYFSGAASTPRAVFPHIEKNAISHLRKIRRSDSDRYRFLENELTRLHTGFNPDEGGYPLRLNLQDQGLFILGYHQMRHWLWMSKDDRRAWREKYKLAGNDAADEITNEGDKS